MGHCRQVGSRRRTKRILKKCSMGEALTCLVTGASAGIGLHTASKLAVSGATVLLHARTLAKAEAAKKEVGGTGKVIPVIGDLSSLSEVQQLAEQAKESCSSLDLLICNAGVFSTSYQKTSSGFETTFAVNVLSHHLLIKLLEPLLIKASSPRLIITSSISQSSTLPSPLALLNSESSFSSHSSYSNSKLCCRMLASYWAAKFPRVVVTSLDPGTVNTKMLLEGWGPCGIPLSQADDTFWLATSPEVSQIFSKSYKIIPDARLTSPAPAATMCPAKS